MKAKEIVKEHIYKHKLFTGLSEEQAMRVSLIGMPAIFRRERMEYIGNIARICLWMK